MSDPKLPPFIPPGERVVLFDGVCKLCNGWVKFLIRHDPRQRFRRRTSRVLPCHPPEGPNRSVRIAAG